MRKALQASVFTLVLSISAYAGDMQFGITDTPPQQPTASTTQSTTTTVEAQDSTTTTDGDMQCPLAETVLSAMGSLLAVL